MRQSLMALFICCTASAAAAQGAITVRVIAVRDVQPIHYQYNDDLRVAVGTGGSIPPALHVRIFPGTKADMLTRRADRTGCVEFSTMVLVVEPSPGGQLFVAHLNSDWLDPVGGISDARYVLVFEEGDDVDGRLRIRQRDVKQYFKYAVEVQIDKGSYRPANVAQAIAQISSVRSAPPPVPKPQSCASVKEATATLAMFTQAACPVPPERNWVRRLFSEGRSPRA